MCIGWNVQYIVMVSVMALILAKQLTYTKFIGQLWLWAVNKIFCLHTFTDMCETFGWICLMNAHSLYNFITVTMGCGKIDNVNTIQRWLFCLKQDLSFIAWNAKGLEQKIQQLQVLVAHLKPDVLHLNETCLTPTTLHSAGIHFTAGTRQVVHTAQSKWITDIFHR